MGGGFAQDPGPRGQTGRRLVGVQHDVHEGPDDPQDNDQGRSWEQTYTYKIDPRRSAAHIGITFTTTSQIFYGLYKVKGDELTFTPGSTDPKVRPKDFESALRVMVLKRKKK